MEITDRAYVKLKGLQARLGGVDPELIPVFAAIGPRPRFHSSGDVYTGLLSSIISQQLSIKAADTIYNRLLDLCPGRIPHPDAVLALSDDALGGAGLSRQKLGYIRNVARFERNQGLARRKLDAMTDDEVLACLTSIKGVGRWTAEMILMFVLDRPDIFPSDDLGIQQAMTAIYRFRSKGRALKRRMHEVAEAWRPHRSYVCCCLWRWKSVAAG